MREPTKTVLTPDVCVVGAGPAGITAALALSSVGRSIVLVESGGYRSSRFAQELNRGEHDGVAYNGLDRTRQRQLGGAANIWNVEIGRDIGAKYVPFDASDLRSWPIQLPELLPHYVEAQALCGLGPFEYGAEYWQTSARRPFRLSGTGITSGVYQFGTAARFVREKIAAIRAVEAIRLLHSSTAVGLELAGSVLRELRVADRGGRTSILRPRATVLACGAVENARMLLLAELDKRCALDWLGRGFMEHARDFSMVLMPYSPDAYAAASFYDQHRGSDGTLIGGRIALRQDAVESLRLPNAAMTLIPRVRRAAERRGLKALMQLATGAAARAGRRRYGWSADTAAPDRFDAFNIVLNVEQLPTSRNRVELGRRCDVYGNRLPRLVLHWSAEDHARLNALRASLAEWFRAAEIGRLSFVEDALPDLNAHHHAGTTRMGETRKDGVVDSDCRVLGVDNLFVAGGSVFPTAGYANPTLSIVALALRLARTIDKFLG